MTNIEILRAQEEIACALWDNPEFKTDKTTRNTDWLNFIDYDTEMDSYIVDGNHNNGAFNLEIYKFDTKTIVKYNIKFINCSFECDANLNPNAMNDNKTTRLFEYNNTLTFENVIFKKSVDCSFIQTNGRIMFERTTFNEMLGKTNFNNTTFSCGIYEPFKEVIFFRMVNFSNTTFEAKANFAKSNFKKEASFFQAVFRTKSYFVETVFDKKVNFNNAIFCDSVDFNSANFKKDVYFHRVVFKQDLQIYRAIFERVANFYFTTFENIVNFSACVIKNPRFLNFVGVDTERITVEKIKNYINKKAGDEIRLKQNQEQNRTEIGLALQHAKNLKDSFRVIKDTLLSQNNLLEAQNWHILELYAKELELGYAIEQEQHKQPRKKQKLPTYNEQYYQNFNVNRIFILLKKLPNLIIYAICIIESLPFVTLIMSAYMLYSFIIFCFDKLQIIAKCLRQMTKSIKPLDWEKTKIFWKHYFKIYFKLRERRIYRDKQNDLDFTLWVDSVILKLYRHTSNHHTNFTTILNFTVGMVVVYAILLLLINYILPYIADYREILSCSIIFVLGSIFLTISLCFIDKSAFHKSLVLLLTLLVIFIVALSNMLLISLAHILCFFMIYFALLSIFYILFHIKRIAYYVRVFMYIFLLAIFILNPQLINPFIGIFTAEKLMTNRLETTLNALSPNVIINLSKISQKEFISHDEYAIKHNVSFVEAQSAKEIIIANKVELNNIISFLTYDKNY